MLHRLALLVGLAWVVTVVPHASAGSLDACAQRVIRDWYSGGRVDSIYPLPCYRAAIDALPNDVLQYSDADRDIARALAFARRGKSDSEESAAKESDRAAAAAPAASVATPPTAPSKPRVVPAPGAKAEAEAPDDTAPSGGPERLASGPGGDEVSGAVPYPVIVLAALAGTLLATGAVGWALARRR